jgi:hypothetical protein
MKDKQEVIHNSQKDKVKFHPFMHCKECGGRMFYYKLWGKYICESWLIMEGGCSLEQGQK